MRKFFGARVVQATKAASAGSSTRRQPVLHRSNLTRPKPSWPHAKHREGLSIRAFSEEELADQLEAHSWKPEIGEQWWTVVYNKKYKSVTKSFMRIVQSGGANRSSLVGQVLISYQILRGSIAFYRKRLGMRTPFCSGQKCSDIEKVYLSPFDAA